MNKKQFIKKLSEKTGYDLEKCNLINNIIEETFIIGKNNKEKMIDKFQNNSFSAEEAEKIYETSMEIIAGEIKNKLKHPFKDQD